LKFIGYCLPDISFLDKRFTKEVYFNYTIFYGKANFGGATFSNKANFSDAQFFNAYFYGATFFNAYFYAATFFNAFFQRATFSNEAFFYRAQFFNEANFNGATFSNKADFNGATFSNKANFGGATFSNKADFGGATFSNTVSFFENEFSNKANFSHAKFTGEAEFSGCFNGRAYFNYVLFEDGKKILFETEDLSKVSFMNTDITRVKFSDRVRWGEKGNFIVEEEMLEKFLKYSFDYEKITVPNSKDSDRLKDYLRQHGVNWKGGLQFTRIVDIVDIKSTLNSLSVDDDSSDTTQQIDDKGSYVFVKDQKEVSSMYIRLDDVSKKANLNIDGDESHEFILKQENYKLKVYPNEEVSLGTVLAVYRNLRENYEFRLRYDEAGKFFMREMELKRRYREVLSQDGSGITKRNCWFRRNLSLTGLYYHFSTYGESIAKPIIIGAITIGLSTLFWLMQSNPTLQPTLSTNAHFPYSNFTGLANATNHIQLLTAFQRSLADFLPLLSLPGDIKVGVIDYIIKIVGGALTFGLLIIALRRKFERKYTR
jgi:uncharacterized protein YjbI with pentapeptide repeats